jgi:hypothetical protein
MTTELTLPEAIETLPKTWKNIEFSQLLGLAALSGIALWCKGIRIFADAQMTANISFNLSRELFDTEQAAKRVEGAERERLLTEAAWLSFFHDEAETRHADDMAMLRAINAALDHNAVVLHKAVTK